MENSSIILLVVSASVSFAIGRLIMYLRKRRRQARMEAARKETAQILRDTPAEPESRNKAKRRRQLREVEKSINKS